MEGFLSVRLGGLREIIQLASAGSFGSLWRTFLICQGFDRDGLIDLRAVVGGQHLFVL